jgi:hypothetical protein
MQTSTDPSTNVEPEDVAMNTLPSQPTPKSNGLLMAVAGFLFAAALGLGFFAFQNYQSNQKISAELADLQQQLKNTKAGEMGVSPANQGAGAVASPSLVTPSTTPAVTPSPTLPPAAAMGTIKGSLSYPAEKMPVEKVCAQNTSTGKEICQNFSEKYYQLSVPPANYQVYAMVANDPANKGFPPSTTKAFYSEFVTCGLNAKCTSHKPIEFEVKAGDINAGIDPQDWYAN